jgi:DNA polymerase I-like protein with 3'-5' exonuclease and polymerase domains
MDIYKELFPEIPRWQTQLLHQVHRDGFLKNPYDYIHRFHQPFKFTKIGTQWEKSPGSDANAIWAFLPQSTAAGIMKEALLRLYFERFEEAGQYLRLTVHDELLSEVTEEFIDQELRVKEEEMGKLIPVLPLPSSYAMGSHLSIGVESKVGKAWGGMRGYHVQ